MTDNRGNGQAAPDAMSADDLIAQVEHVPGKIAGMAGKFLFGVTIAFSAFQIYTAAFTPLSSLVTRSLHVGFLMALTFTYFAARPGPVRTRIPAYDWILAAIGFAVGCYQLVFESDLIIRAGDPSTADLVVGVINIVLVFEAARRVLGPALPLICAVFLGYGLFGNYLPAPLRHRGFDFAQVVDQLAMGTEGIYGIPVLVSSTYIFLFILFGAFLEKAGMIQLFNDLALGTVGHTKGGPAKVAVISSGLMGTINGSGVANVVTTGQFTIPLMKRFGYRAEFAGAVEATSSMGGQIMPPVMGAVAFIMAETIGVPYVDICIAAIVPAILYYFTAFTMVHLEAGRAKLLGLAKEDCPSAIDAIRRQWYLLIPLAVLVFLLFAGYTPLFAGTVGLGLTAIFVLGGTLSGLLSATAGRAIFWILLGLACYGLFQLAGILGIIVIVAVLVAAAFVVRGGRATLSVLLVSLADGAKSALPVGVACALVGVIIGTLTLTGLATTFASLVLSIGEKSLFLSLVLTMIVCLILGMGIPTIPNYIITSSMAAPALLKLGVPLIVSHMFVFYFGIMADLTPPVALAAFAASSIAKAPAMTIGFLAVRIAIAGFVIPFMAVYSPELMLQGDAGLPAIVYVIVKATFAILLWGGAVIGYLWRPMTAIERIAAFGFAALLIAALPLTDEIGFAGGALTVLFHWWRSRRQAQPA